MRILLCIPDAKILWDFDFLRELALVRLDGFSIGRFLRLVSMSGNTNDCWQNSGDHVVRPLLVAIMAEQTERAYQKQAPIFQNKKRIVGQPGKKKELRFVRNVGLGFKTPKEAIEGTYIDKKCPFTGNVSIRGRILTGIVASKKMKHTIVIRRD
ncbi:40S ribosomal protein S11 [Stylophora pistillata]|uniref:Small ribosomal subunit protein uS17 n=1 Tax=Stylophora pistillata TaxID=50429 RepID=A0A2B4SBR4_STYPI|nr:40S ribosomal protein S11 [Stylophora pistillata]